MIVAVDVLGRWVRANGRRLGFHMGIGSGPDAGAVMRLPVREWAALITVLGALCIVLVALGAPSALRALVILPFLLLAPGWAVVRMLDVRDSAMRISLTLALSIAMVGLVSLIQAYSSAWSPAMMVDFSVVITLGAVAVELLVSRGGRR